MSKVKLSVIGVSYSQSQTGAYALVLKEEKGNRRIPIIIGGYEAQVIAIQLEGLKPPRPLTHDLFLNLANAYRIKLIEVQIYRLLEGVFFSKLHFDNGEKEFYIDSRTSDAVALALRFNCPIYTTKEILKKAGIDLKIEDEATDGTSKDDNFIAPSSNLKKEKERKHPSDDESPNADLEASIIEKIVDDILENRSIQELNTMLTDAIDNEEYEKASKIRDAINAKTKGKK